MHAAAKAHPLGVLTFVSGNKVKWCTMERKPPLLRWEPTNRRKAAVVSKVLFTCVSSMVTKSLCRLAGMFLDRASAPRLPTSLQCAK
mmetsp:Transcript_164733/g.400453  ORF Transcript_164733/g.400453 Transcript_164733/m.400453 type:complete len:87 (-) Transcript_164733:474-734(-)